jgi:phosphohistidine phosphatase
VKIVKHLFIVRHGHAQFDAPQDFNRQLSDKGKKAVAQTALFINSLCEKNNISIDLCISSSADRTLQTSQILCQLNNINTLKSYSELYATSVSQWMQKITYAKQNCLLLVGHNPTFSQMVQNLCGYEFYMKPAECALIRLEIQPDGFIYPATLIDTHQNE